MRTPILFFTFGATIQIKYNLLRFSSTCSLVHLLWSSEHHCYDDGKMADVNTARWLDEDNNKHSNELFQILTKIKRKFEILDVVWHGERTFEAKFRTQIPRNNDDFNDLCDEWVEIFSKVTETVWVKKISNTGPKIRFRKQYQCWTQGGEVKKELLFDPSRCKGTLDIKVLSDNFVAKRTHKHIRLGLNIVVKIHFHHLHLVDRTQSNSFFVHKCEPLKDIPRRIIEPNKKLSEMVAAMVQNGPAVSRKNAEKAKKILSRHGQDASDLFSVTYEENTQPVSNEQPKEDPLMTGQNSVLESTNFQTLQPVKIDNHASSQKCTQFIINTSNPGFDVGEQFLMFQPLLFDVPQFISLSTQTLSPQFIQIQQSIQNNVLSKDGGINQNGHIT